MYREKIGDAILYRGDALEMLQSLDAQSVDALITDPPYSSGGAFRGDRVMDTRSKYLQSDSGNLALENFGGDNRDQRNFHFWSCLWAAAALRACKPGAPGLLFTDWRQLPVSTDYLQGGGWVWRGVVPWFKRSARPRSAASPPRANTWCGAAPARCRSTAASASCPASTSTPHRPTASTSRKSGRADGRHGAHLQRRRPSARSLHGFRHHGVAAVQLGRRFIGCEQSPHFFDVACRRIEAALQSRRMFDAPAAARSLPLDMETP